VIVVLLIVGVSRGFLKSVFQVRFVQKASERSEKMRDYILPLLASAAWTQATGELLAHVCSQCSVN